MNERDKTIIEKTVKKFTWIVEEAEYDVLSEQALTIIFHLALRKLLAFYPGYKVISIYAEDKFRIFEANKRLFYGEATYIYIGRRVAAA